MSCASPLTGHGTEFTVKEIKELVTTCKIYSEWHQWKGRQALGRGVFLSQPAERQRWLKPEVTMIFLLGIETAYFQTPYAQQ